jgi:hypothetical protein
MASHGGDALGFEPEERLPWLEPSEPVQDSVGGSGIAQLVGLVLAGLVAIGLVVGGLWWWQQHQRGGNGELVEAPAGPYKVAPKAEPGRFDGEGNVAVAAAEGVQPTGTVDAGRLPENPVPPAMRPVAPPAAGNAAPAPAAAPKAPAAGANGQTPAVAARVSVAPPAAAPAGTIQLGAYDSEAAAARAWDSLKARFEWLGPVNRVITPATVNGRTFYRLRASAGANARDYCSRLRVAGENCILL